MPNEVNYNGMNSKKDVERIISEYGDITDYVWILKELLAFLSQKYQYTKWQTDVLDSYDLTFYFLQIFYKMIICCSSKLKISIGFQTNLWMKKQYCL
jgi:hypothetical protein